VRQYYPDGRSEKRKGSGENRRQNEESEAKPCGENRAGARRKVSEEACGREHGEWRKRVSDKERVMLRDGEPVRARGRQKEPASAAAPGQRCATSAAAAHETMARNMQRAGHE